MLGLSKTRNPAGFHQPADGWGNVTEGIMRLFGTPQTAATATTAPYYGEWSAMGIPAAWRCATLIADTVGSLPMFAYFDENDGAEAKLEPNLELLDNPWPMIGRHNYNFGVVWSMLLRGDAFALPADPDPATGYPRQAVLLNPDAVWVDTDDRGMPIYHVGDLDLGPGEIIHYRGITPPGALRGIGVIEAHRQGLSTQVALQQYGYGGFSTSGMPSAIVTVDKPELGREQADDIKARWMAATSNRREPVVIPRTFTFSPVGFSPQDMEYIEARKVGATEICWCFGVHPSVIGAPSGGSLTYVNQEAANQAFAQQSIIPWTNRIEQATSLWTPRRYQVRFNYDAFLRATTAERYAAEEIGLRIGVLTLNEVRDLEHRPRYEAWADEPFGTPPADQPEEEPEPPVLSLIEGEPA